MSLISRLGRKFREKPKSTNLDLPGLPNPREILEDIESCQNGDPIIALATLIQKKGRQSSLLDKDFLEDPSTTSQLTISSPLSAHLAFLAPYQLTTISTTAGTGGGSLSSEKTPATEDTTSGSSHQHGRRGSLVTGGGGNSAKSKNKAALDAEQLASYNKLKQFLLLFEKSEEILDNLEPHFKRVEAILKQRDTNCNDDNKVEIDDPSNDVPVQHATTVIASLLSKNITATLENDVLKVEAETDPEDDDEEEVEENGNGLRRTRQVSSESDVGSSSLL